jgi:predicted O-methyltransferase YrrM
VPYQLRPLLRRFAVSALKQGSKNIDQCFKDIDHERQRQAVATTADFVNKEMRHLAGQRGKDALDAKLTLLRWALDQAPSRGLVVEFGVATGLTLRVIAAKRLPAHGFDSFEGLPENWRSGYRAGTFAQKVPEVGGAELHVGWFDDSVPKFLAEYPEPFAFVHMDADLYSSTKTVFEVAFDRFIPGTVIVFDEYFNYPGWELHEHRAFMEFLQGYKSGFEYLGYNALHEQVVVRLI